MKVGDALGGVGAFEGDSVYAVGDFVGFLVGRGVVGLLVGLRVVSVGPLDGLGVSPK